MSKFLWFVVFVVVASLSVTYSWNNEDFQNLISSINLNKMNPPASFLSYDCGEDMNCFTDKLLFCESARVKIPIGYSESYWGTTFIATSSTYAEVEGYVAKDFLGHPLYMCEVIFTDLNVRKQDLWESARCHYFTNEPHSDEMSWRSPKFKGCVELRN